MKTNNMNRQVCYNVQTAVDTKNHLIVAHEVTNTTDNGQLGSVATLAQKAVGRKDITVLADKGYYSRSILKQFWIAEPWRWCQREIPLVLNVRGSITAQCSDITGKKMFMYAQWAMSLQNRFTSIEDGLEQQLYFNNIACRDCTK